MLTGDALVNENARLQIRINQLLDRIELSFRQALRTAQSQGNAPETDASAHANLLVSYVIGRWYRYAKSGFKLSPTTEAETQIRRLF